MSDQTPLPCQVALQKWKNLMLWRNLWSGLIFVFGMALVGFLCAAVLLYIKQSWLSGALTTVGTIVDGVSVTWLVSRRLDAAKEEDAVFKEVKTECAVRSPASGQAVAHPESRATEILSQVQDEINIVRKKTNIPLLNSTIHEER